MVSEKKTLENVDRHRKDKRTGAEGIGILIKGLGSRRGEIGPAIEMHTDLKYVYMVYLIEKNRNFICLVLKL